MPGRILKESICTSDNLDRLSAFQETFFYRLIVNCDDYGRMDARPAILKSKLYPLKDLRAGQIEDALRALTSAELVTLYYVDGKPFVQMKTWNRHQTPRAKKSKYPDPPEDCEQIQADENICKQMHTDAVDNRNSIIDNRESIIDNRNSQSQSGARARFSIPTVDEVREYCESRHNTIDAQEFVDFYTAKGWRIGKEPMKDWKACVRTWERKRQDKTEPDSSSKWGIIGQMV